MSAPLLERVKQFLAELETVQEGMSKLFREKRAALTEARSDELLRLAETEAAWAKRLQKALADRQQILRLANQAGLPGESVVKLVAAIAGDERPRLESRIAAAERRSLQIRQESWIHWIIAHRAYNHYTELLDLFANCGQRAPTYSQRPSEKTSGGAILDASV